jgi:hypothetical protein
MRPWKKFRKIYKCKKNEVRSLCHLWMTKPRKWTYITSTRNRAIAAMNQWSWRRSRCWLSTKWRTRQWFNWNGTTPEWTWGHKSTSVRLGTLKWNIREPSRFKFLITAKFSHTRLYAALRGCRGCGAYASFTEIICNNPKSAHMTSMHGYEWSISVWFNGGPPSNRHYHRVSGYEIGT